MIDTDILKKSPIEWRYGADAETALTELPDIRRGRLGDEGFTLTRSDDGRAARLEFANDERSERATAHAYSANPDRLSEFLAKTSIGAAVYPLDRNQIQPPEDWFELACRIGAGSVLSAYTSLPDQRGSLKPVSSLGELPDWDLVRPLARISILEQLTTMAVELGRVLEDPDPQGLVGYLPEDICGLVEECLDADLTAEILAKQIDEQLQAQSEGAEEPFDPDGLVVIEVGRPAVAGLDARAALVVTEIDPTFDDRAVHAGRADLYISRSRQTFAEARVSEERGNVKFSLQVAATNNPRGARVHTRPYRHATTSDQDRFAGSYYRWAKVEPVAGGLRATYTIRLAHFSEVHAGIAGPTTHW